jgi:oxygen-dependent protoporphyrinogen oxidase
VTDRSVAVIGGGISGLAAAHHLLDAGASVTVFESASTLGGKIASATVDGIALPTAPDAFLARQPQVIDLATELGLGDQLIAPTAREARIARGTVLHPLPPNLLGIPTDIDALQASELISPEGVSRAALDLDAADDRPDGDESVGALVRRRLGDEVLEYLVDPLLGGINAGDSDQLSALSGVPQVGAARALAPSLIEAVRMLRARATPNPEAPVFLTPIGGLQALIDALDHRIRQDATVRCDTAATIAGTPQAWTVNGQGFDHVIVATPAAPASNLLDHLAPSTATEIRKIESSSVALVLLVLPPDSIDLHHSISGVLVPRLEGRTITAVSIATHKWPHLTSDGRIVLRVSVGRRTKTAWLDLDDAQLVDAITSDLAELIGLRDEPIATHVTRWMDALPQYDVDHAQRVERIENGLAQEAPGIHLAGPMLRGLGLPACVGGGRAAAAQALQ